MEAITFEIFSKWRERPFAIAYVDDFDLREQGRVPASEILSNRNISLYSLDLEEKRAIFVETPPSVDLSAAPFYFVAQFDHAIRVLTISFETMIKQAK
jgi:hypothetical protein